MTVRLRVLHVVRKLDPGGVETWLCQLLECFDRSRFKIDIAVTCDEPGRLEPKVRRLGARVHRLGHPRNLLRFARRFRQIVGAFGPYRVVHAHLHHFSGILAWLAAREGIPHRITHSHSDRRHAEGRGIIRQTYLAGMKALVRRYGTLHLAVSSEAAEALYGPRWRDLSDVAISRCGLDFRRFGEVQKRRDELRRQLRAELGVPSRALVVGTVGRLVEVKNQAFLVDLLRELRRAGHDAYLVIAGDGPLRGRLVGRAQEIGVEANMRLLGIRQDIPELLSSLYDVCVLPSLYEGLPLVALEAQAAGVPLLMSSNVTAECIVIKDLVRRLPLDDGPRRWAEILAELAHLRQAIDAGGCWKVMEESSFSIRSNVEELARFYEMPVSGESSFE